MLEIYIDGLRLKERRLQNTKTAFFATDAHLREIRPFILSPDALGFFWKTWERDMEAGLSNLIYYD